jgi:phosphomannomutase
MTESINSKIFKAYDVRGVYPDEINEDVAEEIGRAFIKFLVNNGEIGKRQIVVGRDTRLSSADLFEAITGGILSQEADIIDIGQVSTPLFYWAVIKTGAAGGVMITASHNPAKFNGFKFCRSDARPISADTGLGIIRELARQNQSFALSPLSGKIISQDLLVEYLDYLKTKIKTPAIKPLKLVIDCGNGVIGPEITELIKMLSCQTKVLYAEPDGEFPNHAPNPLLEENLVDLKREIKNGAADLGVVFDGDGDRAVFVDEKGETVRGDFITALIAKEILAQRPGQKILYEVRTSKIVPETITAAGGAPILGRPGHSLMKERMWQEKIAFGGELSGHYFFEELGFVDNAVFAMLYVLKILSREDKKFSEILAPLKKYWHSGEINFEVADADAVLADAEKHFGGGQIKKIDGLTVEYPDWWFNLRKSNTEPLVRLNLEANSAELMEEKREELIGLING